MKYLFGMRRFERWHGRGFNTHASDPFSTMPHSPTQVTMSLAKIRRISVLGYSDNDTSLLANATGSRALSYIEQRRRAMIASVSNKFEKSAAVGVARRLPAGTDTTYML